MQLGVQAAFRSSDTAGKSPFFSRLAAVRWASPPKTQFAVTGKISASNFVANTSGVALDADDFLVYDTDSGNLYYDANGGSAGGSVLIAHFEGNPDLTYRNFLIV